jgi:hypothetical protein
MIRGHHGIFTLIIARKMKLISVIFAWLHNFQLFAGITLYDFYQPAVLLARKKFENGETTLAQFTQDLKVAEAALSEAVAILGLEPETRPEAIIHRKATKELKELKDTIRDVELKKSIGTAPV